MPGQDPWQRLEEHFREDERFQDAVEAEHNRLVGLIQGQGQVIDGQAARIRLLEAQLASERARGPIVVPVHQGGWTMPLFGGRNQQERDRLFRRQMDLQQQIQTADNNLAALNASLAAAQVAHAVHPTPAQQAAIDNLNQQIGAQQAHRQAAQNELNAITAQLAAAGGGIGGQAGPGGINVQQGGTVNIQNYHEAQRRGIW